MKRNFFFIFFDTIIILHWTIFFSLTYSISSLVCLLHLPFFFFIPSVFLAAFSALTIMAFLLPRPKEGRYKFNHKQALYWCIQFQFARVWNFPPIKHFIFSIGILRILFMKANGAKISYSTSISSYANLHDLYMLNFGQQSTIGLDVTIVGHYIIKNYLIIGPITIGERSTIGAKSMIGPYCSVGNDCLIEIDCRILPHAKVPHGKRLKARTILTHEKEI